jgi:hypothetical protein
MGVKRPGREADSTPQSGGEDQNEWMRGGVCRENYFPFFILVIDRLSDDNEVSC